MLTKEVVQIIMPPQDEEWELRLQEEECVLHGMEQAAYITSDSEAHWRSLLIGPTS